MTSGPLAPGLRGQRRAGALDAARRALWGGVAALSGLHPAELVAGAYSPDLGQYLPGSSFAPTPVAATPRDMAQQGTSGTDTGAGSQGREVSSLGGAPGGLPHAGTSDLVPEGHAAEEEAGRHAALLRPRRESWERKVWGCGREEGGAVLPDQERDDQLVNMLCAGEELQVCSYTFRFSSLAVNTNRWAARVLLLLGTQQQTHV